MKYNNYSFTKESSGYLDEGLRIYMLSIYKNMSMALGISGLVAYIIGSNTQIAMMLFSTPLAYVIMFAPLIYIFFFSRNLMSMDKQQAMLHLGIFAALNGLSLGSIFLVYTSASIVTALLGTTVSFGALAGWGYFTKRDISGWGPFLFAGVIGLIVVGIINIFVASTALQMTLNVLAILIFLGLTAYDMNRIRDMFWDASQDEIARMQWFGALSLYINFINIFISILQLFGNKE